MDGPELAVLLSHWGGEQLCVIKQASSGPLHNNYIIMYHFCLSMIEHFTISRRDIICNRMYIVIWIKIILNPLFYLLAFII